MIRYAGRWTGSDPYNGSISISDPQSFNRYAYVQNDPINFRDPSGLNMIMIGGGVYDCRDYCGSVNGGPSSCETHCTLVAYFGGMGSSGGGVPPIIDPGPRGGGITVGPSPPKGDTCTLTVYVSAVSLSGSSSGGNNRENPPAGRVGLINHLYLTYSDSRSGLTIGLRGGPVSVNAGESDYLMGSFGLYQRGGFIDFEINPKAAATETYDESCDKFDKSFKETVNKLDKAKIKYSATGNNSNAFLYTVLNRAGINAGSFTPRINQLLGYFGTAVGWGATVPIP